MLTFRRALVAAAFFLTFFYLVTRPHTPLSPAAPAAAPAPPAPALGRQDASDGVRQQQASTTAASRDRRPSGAGLARPDRVAGHGSAGGQKPLRDMARMGLYDQLAYQFPYDVDAKFPAYIWQTWKWTPANTEFSFREQEATWTEQHPGFVHEVITDAVAVHLLRLLYASVPTCSRPTRPCRCPCSRPTSSATSSCWPAAASTRTSTPSPSAAPSSGSPTACRARIGLVVGIEADPDRPDWKDWYSRRVQFCQWTIQAKPGHPVLRDIVARVTAETLRRRRTGELDAATTKNVIEFTGPALWTDVIFEYFNDDRYFDMATSKGAIDWRNFTGMEAPKRVGDVIVLPITSFSPGVQQMGAKDYDDPMAFVKHDFEGMSLSLAR